MKNKKSVNNPFVHIISCALVLIAVFAAGCRNTTAYAEGADRMYVFNMGFDGMQGSLILVESDGRWGLVDTGHRSADTIQDANGRIIPAPASEQYSNQISMRNGKDVAQYMVNVLGVRHLDFIVGTHSHMDHIGGVPEIATTAYTDTDGRTRYLVDNNTTYFYKEYQHIADFEDDLARYSDLSWHNQAYYYQAVKTMREQGANLVDVSKQQVVQGDPGNAYGDYVTFTMGNMTFRLYNVYEQTNTGSENVNSIVTVMTNGDYTVVNLSDINTGNAAIDRTSEAIGKDFGAVDVVVAGHHGYAGSNTKTMFDELQPNFVVVSSDAGHDSWLYTDCDLAAAIPYAQKLFGTSFFSTALSPYAIVTDLSGNQVYVYNLESNGVLTDAFYKIIKSSQKTGWVSWMNTGKTLWSYLENGVPLRDAWGHIDDRWYHFDTDGIMQTGLVYVDGMVRYLDDTGALTVGWRQFGEDWYYFEEEYGARVTNAWHQIGGKWYFFDNDGILRTGWLTDEGGTRYVDPENYTLTVGWKMLDGIWYYFEENFGYRVTNAWHQIDGKWYFFDGNGIMQTGWLTDEGGTRYVDPETATLTVGWKEIDGVRYYFEENFGYRVTNAWHQIDGKWYFFDGNGIMQTGWLTDEGGTRYVDPETATLTVGWKEIDGVRYCFEENFGYKITNDWHCIDGKWYFFDGNGIMQTGWLTDEGGTRYVDPETATLTVGWKQIDGVWYCFEENFGYKITNAWHQIDGKWYFFDGNGIMQTGWLTDEGGTRYVDPETATLTVGWKQIDGKWYFFEENFGYRITNAWQRDNNKEYHFDENGIMQTGWLTDEGGTRYCDESGAMLLGWNQIDGSWYFFEGEFGYRLTNCEQEMNGILYTFDEDGRAERKESADEKEQPQVRNTENEVVQKDNSETAAAGPGWQEIGGNWYYFNEDGSKRTGWQEIDGNWYYFYDDGSMAKDTVIEGYYVNADGVWIP